MHVKMQVEGTCRENLSYLFSSTGQVSVAENKYLKFRWEGPASIACFFRNIFVPHWCGTNMFLKNEASSFEVNADIGKETFK